LGTLNHLWAGNNFERYIPVHDLKNVFNNGLNAGNIVNFEKLYVGNICSS
jgi:hypothetical protein